MKTQSKEVRDHWQRPLRSMRLSLTDRCNLRCTYCMPEEHYKWLPKKELLSFEEWVTLVSVFTNYGVRRVRLTGGEPLLRNDVPRLVQMLRRVPGIDEITLTTNGVLLAQHAHKLHDAHLSRITISLDTGKADRFVQLTGRDRLGEVVSGIEAMNNAGFAHSKLNAVIMRGFNDDEIVDLMEFGKRHKLEVRFIEYMDVGGATSWSAGQVFSQEEILQRLESHYGPITTAQTQPHAPAQRFSLTDGTHFGIIASTTSPFCQTCDRSRITADGMWFLCLYAQSGIDLKRVLRSKGATEELRQLIKTQWAMRTDRGAEERLQMETRGPLVPLSTLQKNPHLEMHTRGG